MLQYGLCFALFLLSAVRAKQNRHQLDGSRGLKRGVHVGQLTGLPPLQDQRMLTAQFTYFEIPIIIFLAYI